MPLGDVKGPAGVGYPVSISYHAGIQQEQEASWVGLGWDLNVGAINRTVRGFPDDYASNRAIQYLFNEGDYSWTLDVGFGVYGASATVGWTYLGSTGGVTFDGLTGVGFGYSVEGFNAGISADIRSGSISIGVGYGVKGNANGSVGVTFGKNGPVWSTNVGFSAAGSGNAQQPIAGFSLNSNGQIGFSAGGYGAGGGGFVMSDKGYHVESSGLGIYIPFVIYGVYFSFQLSFSQTAWYYAGMEYGNVSGYLFNNTGGHTVIDNLETNNDVLLNAQGGILEDKSKIRKELAKVQSGYSKCENVSDVDINHLYDKNEYIKGTGFCLSSQDNYVAVGQGLLGVFKPFVEHSYKSCFSTDIAYDGIVGVPTSIPNGVDDNYSYSQHFNSQTDTFSTRFSSGITFKMLQEGALNIIDECDVAYAVPIGESAYKIDAFNNIDVVTVTENAHTIQTNNNTYGMQIEPLFESEGEITNKLHGFIITDQQGKRYYYSEPLFLLQDIKYVNSIPDYPKNNSGQMSFNNTHSYHALLDAYATTWLLTAVTGPDYVKMVNGGIGVLKKLLPNDGDLGYWVAFHYEYGDDVTEDAEGKPITSSGEYPHSKVSYKWRFPFFDSKTGQILPHMTQACAAIDENKRTYVSEFGMKEITYLKSIETSTEVAYFRTSTRLDGYGIDDESYPKFAPNKIEANGITITTDGHKLSKTWFEDLATKNATPNSYNLSKCIQIKVDLSEMTLKQFTDLEDGTDFCTIEFEGTGQYEPYFPWSPCCQSKTTRGIVNITKDFIGCYQNMKDLSTLNKISKESTLGPSERYLTKLKCFYAKEGTGIDAGKLILYLTNYNFFILNNPWNYKSAISFDCVDNFTWNWNSWDISNFTDVHARTVWLNGTFLKYRNRNPIVKFVKKLDEIAWYSKAKYSYLNRYSDPGYPSAKNSLGKPDPYPQSYRSVKFRYDYSLAKGTPNSIAQGKGRLTLKEVRVEAGPEEKPMVMPPYLFSYQNQDEPYLGYDKNDPWGFAKATPNGEQTSPQLGVNWNLSKILMPSCGSIGISYERDQINSGLGTIYRIKADDVCIENSVLMPDEKYFTNYTVVSYNESERKITLDNTVGLQKGMYLVGHFLYTASETRTVIYSGTNECQYNDYLKKERYRLFYRIEKVNTDNTIVIDHPFTTTTEPLIDIKVIKNVPLVCDGIRTKQIVTKTGEKAFTTIYKYPDAGGVLSVLPMAVIPKLIDTSKSIVEEVRGSCGISIESENLESVDGKEFDYFRDIDYYPVSPDIGKNYSASISQVMYPSVEVFQTNSGGQTKRNGYSKYYYWTVDDKVTIGGVETPLVVEKDFSGATNLKVHQIVDRQGIIGMPKKTEYYKQGNDNSPIYVKNYNYSFSDELPGKSSVYYEGLSASATLGSDKPLGLTRERAIRLERQTDGTFPARVVTDIITFKPFLTEITEKTDNVTASTQFGWFDARTGSPMATLTNYCKVKEGKLRQFIVNLPYNFICNDATKIILKKMNIFSLAGLNIVAGIPEAKAVNKPKDIDYAILTSTSGLIKSAGVQLYKQTESPAGALFAPQSHFWAYQTATWKGGVFTGWPTIDNLSTSTDWLEKSKLTHVDGYTRPLSEINLKGDAVSATYHPRMNAVIGAIQNAQYNEYAVYTCDYEDQSYTSTTLADATPNDIDKSKLDFINNWMRNQSVLSSAVTHFGQLSVHVKASADGKNEGPSKQGITIKANTDYYIFSAWVYPVTVSATDPICLAVEKVGATSNTAIGTADAEKMTTLVSGSTKGWQFVSRRIKSTDFTAGDKIRILICSRTAMGTQTNAEYYVDDIRFYPANALLSTFYYDANLGVPITLVDPKNHASYSKYDAFGRLIEKGFIKE